MTIEHARRGSAAYDDALRLYHIGAITQARHALDDRSPGADRDNPDQIVLSARLYLASYQPLPAESCARAVLDRDAGHAIAAALLAEALIRQKRADEAESVLGRFAGLNDVPELCLARGNLALSRSAWQQANEQFDAALSLAPHFAEARLMRAQLMIRHNRLDLAAADLAAVAAMRPNWSSGHLIAAKLATVRGDTAEAEALLKSALIGEPPLAEAYTLMAQLLLQTGRLAEAEATLTAAIGVFPDSPELFLQLVRLQLASNRAVTNVDRLAQLLNKGIAPDLPELALRAAIQQDAAGLSDRACEALIAKGQLTAGLSALYAQYCLERQQVERTAAVIAPFLALDVPPEWARDLNGQIKVQRNEYEAAAEIFEELHAENSENSKYIHVLLDLYDALKESDKMDRLAAAGIRRFHAADKENLNYHDYIVTINSLIIQKQIIAAHYFILECRRKFIFDSGLELKYAGILLDRSKLPAPGATILASLADRALTRCGFDSALQAELADLVESGSRESALNRCRHIQDASLSHGNCWLLAKYFALLGEFRGAEQMASRIAWFGDPDAAFLAELFPGLKIGGIQAEAQSAPPDRLHAGLALLRQVGHSEDNWEAQEWIAAAWPELSGADPACCEIAVQMLERSAGHFINFWPQVTEWQNTAHQVFEAAISNNAFSVHNYAKYLQIIKRHNMSPKLPLPDLVQIGRYANREDDWVPFIHGALDQDDPDLARKIIVEALERFPDSESIQFSYLRLLLDAERLAECLDVIRSIPKDSKTYLYAQRLKLVIYMKLRKFQEVEHEAREMLAKDADDIFAHGLLGALALKFKYLIGALEHLDYAVSLGDTYGDQSGLRGAVLNMLCRPEDARLQHLEALKLDPDNLSRWTSYLFDLSYHPDFPAAEIFAAFRTFGQRQRKLLDTTPHAVVRNPYRRLRIGYVSPDFRAHTSRFYYFPLLENHDRGEVELFAYAEMIAPDAVTPQFRRLFDHWRPIAGKSDARVAEMIRRDRIDILIDGTNHMEDNRLGVFARKPAPIQMTWLGSIWTTGLEAVDYTIQDPYMAPPGTEAVFVEKIRRLPHSLFCFRPSFTPDLTPAPILKNGYVTFGYTGRTERLNDRVFAAWAKILQALPTARLIVDYSLFHDTATCSYFKKRFEAAGMPVDRVSLSFSRPVWDGLAQIDILLDSFPHSGGTMLFDGLWAGVPFLTLAERPPCGRIGAGLLHNLELADWVTDNEADYVARAIEFAGQPGLLNELRQGMRDRMRASPLMDEPGFARAMEQAYRDTWTAWCGGAPPEASAQYPAPTAAERAGGRLRHQVRFAQSEGRFSDALALARQEQASYPDSPDVAIAVIIALLETADWQQASPLLARLMNAPEPVDGLHEALARFYILEGRVGEALAAAIVAAERQPSEPMPLILQAQARLLSGDITEAERLCLVALQWGSDFAPGLLTLAIVRVQQNRPEPAEQILRRAQTMAPADAAIPANLALLLATQGQLDEAIIQARRAVALKPHLWKTHSVIAELHRKRGEWPAAVVAFEAAFEYMPTDRNLLLNLTDALRIVGRHEEAIARVSGGLALWPDDALLWLNLGAAQQSGDLIADAIQSYQKALALDPSTMAAYSNLVGLLARQQRLDDAEQVAREALRRDPDHAETLMHLGIVYFLRRRLVEARALTERALAFMPDNATNLASLAIIDGYLCDHDRAAEEYERAIAVQTRPDEVLQSARLYILSYHPTKPVSAIYDEFVRWGDRHRAMPKLPARSRNGEDPERRLRIGYVSPDFRKHTSRFYYEPLFEHLDRRQVELFAYANMRTPDEVTARFQRQFDHWRPIFGVPDSVAAAMVARDGIDILIDGTNHMQDNRLLMFARKPAPIQVTWLGSIWTSGLEAMDYSLQDPYLAPPGAEAVFREKIWRLPHSLFCFRPPESAPAEVAPLPALANRHLTFGYFGRTERLNDRVFKAWGQLLTALPDARLILDFLAFGDPMTAAYFRQRMATMGVPIERVTLGYSTELWGALSRIDVMLDSFPHSGGTMLFDGLWAGVPALTLAERPPCGRIGAGLMMNLDLPQWVVPSEADYVARGIALGADIEGLASLRASLRDRMRASPLMDEAGFARAMEAAYRGMWRQWCAGS